MKITVAVAKQKLAQYVGNGKCSDSPEVLETINLASERFITSGKWVGVTPNVGFCVYGNCLTLPEHYETILGITVNGFQMNIKNSWWSLMPGNWIASGYYGQSGSGCGTASCGPSYSIVDRGDGFVSFKDICGTAYLKVYADLPEDAGAEILLQGYDENNNPISTLVSDSWVDGEYVGINASTPQTSTKLFSSLTGVIKPETNGPVRLYAVNPDTMAQSVIAIYNPGETVPCYRRYWIPGGSESCKTVVAKVKLRFVEAKRDTDVLPIGNLNAYIKMLQAINKGNNNLPEQAKQAYEAEAYEFLNNELKEHYGDSATGAVRIVTPALRGRSVICRR